MRQMSDMFNTDCLGLSLHTNFVTDCRDCDLWTGLLNSPGHLIPLMYAEVCVGPTLIFFSIGVMKLISLHYFHLLVMNLK